MMWWLLDSLLIALLLGLGWQAIAGLRPGQAPHHLLGRPVAAAVDHGRELALERRVDLQAPLVAPGVRGHQVDELGHAGGVDRRVPVP